ncbi:hypothetical protein EJB05_36208, partial [Eragrostis curvula]
MKRLSAGAVAGEWDDGGGGGNAAARARGMNAGIMDEQVLALVFRALNWDPQSLCVVARVSRRLRAVAERVLWRELCANAVKWLNLLSFLLLQVMITQSDSGKPRVGAVIALFNIQTLSLMYLMSAVTSCLQQVNRLEITPDKRFLAAAGNPHIRLFDVNSNSPQPVISYDSHTSNVMAVGFHCDGNWMYSGSEDGTVRIWDLRNVVCLFFQKELISGDQNGNIRVWDLAANSCSCELVPEVDTAVRSLTVMWDGSMVVAANNRGTCYVWRLLKGTQTITCFEPLHKLQAHDGYILKCLLSPEFCDPNRYLATASSDHTVKIWNVDGFKLERTLVGNVPSFVFNQPSALGLGLCVLSRRRLSDNWYVPQLTIVLFSTKESVKQRNCCYLSQLLLIAPRDYGPCQPERPSGCTRDITRQPLVVLSMTERNQRPHSHFATHCTL